MRGNGFGEGVIALGAVRRNALTRLEGERESFENKYVRLNFEERLNLSSVGFGS